MKKEKKRVSGKSYRGAKEPVVIVSVAFLVIAIFYGVSDPESISLNAEQNKLTGKSVLTNLLGGNSGGSFADVDQQYEYEFFDLYTFMSPGSKAPDLEYAAAVRNYFTKELGRPPIPGDQKEEYEDIKKELIQYIKESGEKEAYFIAICTFVVGESACHYIVPSDGRIYNAMWKMMTDEFNNAYDNQ